MKDTIRFGEGIKPESIRLARSGDDMIFKYSDTDQITVKKWFGNDAVNWYIEQVQFADGTVWDLATILSLADRTLNNKAPVLGVALPNQVAAATFDFNVSIPVDTIVDADPGDIVTYGIKMQDGSVLPSWLGFDVATRTLHGKPTIGDVGALNLIIVGTDHFGLSVAQNFTLTVNPANRSPVLSVPLSDQVAKKGIAWAFAIPEASFSDPDVGDMLTYSAYLSDGSALPAWLSFEPISKTFSGTPTSIGTVSLKISVNDRSNLSVSDVFDLNISIADQLLNGTAGDDVLVGNVGDDVIAGLAGNDSLKGAAGNDIYVFNRGDGQDTINNLDLLAATDTLRFATGVVDTDVLAFKSGNDVQFKIKGTTDQVVVTNYFAANTTISGRAADYKIDKVEFSNAVSWNQTMIQTMVDRATNNKAPTLGTALPNQVAKATAAYSLTVPANTFVDADTGDTVTYSLKMQNGTALPAWLSFNAATRVLSGTPAVGDISTLNLSLVGTDNYGLNVAQNFSLTVNPANRAPVVAVALPDQTASQGTAWTYTVSANSFTDPDAGDTLTYSATLADGAALPVWLSFNATTRLFSGTPTSTGTVSVKVSAKDSGNLSVADVFDVVINVANFNLTGTSGADTLTGGAGNDTLSGLAGNDKLTGGAGDDLLDGGAGTDTMLGGLGNDTYIVDVTTDVVTENLNEGTDTIKSSVTYPLPTNVENLILTGTTAINGTGNALTNVITGNSANNTLDGGAGADTLIGGAGNDTYVVDDINDTITELTNEGTDLVNSSVSYTLPANVENLTLTGTSALNGAGNTLPNTITGNSAANIIDGGAGVDTMIGGAGNDTYVVDATADVITELTNEGNDSVNSSATYSLPTNVENLTLTGTANINASGNASPNVLTGNAGNNILDGGTGADTMVGGAGDDTYVVDSLSDVVTEASNGGTDLVQTSISLTIPVNVENMTLTGTGVINATGNAVANVITGNSAANLIDGGAGADTMIGGAGDDSYVVDDVNDVITELTAEGTDSVSSSVSYTLPANVENVTLTGTAALNATGNALPNTITGNSGANIIDGGAGIDTMIGGAGEDTYIVDNTADVITEATGGGTDLVKSSATYTLTANVENLTLTGTAAINATGNTLPNIMTGNSSNNILDGGTGADTMTGGAGNDAYVVDDANDKVLELANEGNDQVKSSITYTLPANLEALLLTGTSAINGTGNELDNLLTGNAGNNVLNGAAGNDILQGVAGDDTLTDTVGNNLFDGGAGIDTITAGVGNDFIAGGVGNDMITTGTGADVIAFNRGDGMDVLNSSTGKDNTISLGEGIKYADLLFKKSANDLILVTGTSEQITIKDWYASVNNHSIANLQIVIEGTTDYSATSTNKLNNKKIEQFNFDGLVTAFDQARAANPSLTSWALSSSLLNFYLAGSDTAAIGGDLAYQYAKSGSLSAFSMLPAQTLLSNAQFGTGNQNLQAVGTLADSTVRLI